MYADGGGLYLQVTASGAKSWIFRYRFGAKRRDMGLGPLHTVSLADARSKATECRALKLAGDDPIEHHRQALAAKKAALANQVRFKEAAAAYIESHRAGWRNAKHADQWTTTLSTYAYPHIGDMPVGDVAVAHIMRVLDPIWREKTETASRLRGRIESVLDWATVQGYRAGENPARWRGHLENLLPKQSKVAQVKHHSALPYCQVPALMQDLRARSGVSSLALRFLVLTAARTGEVIKAEWPEVDTAAAIWTVPAGRMKAHKEHRVPLCDEALQILKQLRRTSGPRFLFSSAEADKAPSNMSLLALLKRMGKADITAHGFRSTFRDWAAETTDFPDYVVEMALAHTIADKVEAAYRRGDLFDKRRALMKAWGDFCAGRSQGDVGKLPK